MSYSSDIVDDMVSEPYRQVTESQRAFVLGTGAVLDSRGWAVDYRDNLVAPLHSDSLDDFVACSEVSEDGHGGRISAPHSSTALAVNTFDWWRGRSLRPISDALGVDIERFAGFEQAHDFTLDRPSQPDVQFTASDGSAVAVEVKLREPYGRVSNPFADKYFVTKDLWDGLPNLEGLARCIRCDDKTTFTTLHAAQLIKHALGLRHSYGDYFTLVYYWHHLSGEIGDQHWKELAAFDEIARNDFSFIAVTVDQLLGSFVPNSESKAWFDT